MHRTWKEVNWKEFLEEATNEGFKIGYSKNFESEFGKEEEVIMYHQELGIILFADSYSGEKVNDVRGYAELKYNEIGSQWNLLVGCTYSSPTTDIVQVFFEYRIIFDTIKRVKSGWKFNARWSKPHFELNLINFKENTGKYPSYLKITQKKIEESSEEIQKIINM